MTKLSSLIEEVIVETVPVSEEREAILEAIQLQGKFGNSKTVDILDKYEKIIEGLIK
jgi:hypothetical protein